MCCSAGFADLDDQHGPSVPDQASGQPADAMQHGPADPQDHAYCVPQSHDLAPVGISAWTGTTRSTDLLRSLRRNRPSQLYEHERNAGGYLWCCLDQQDARVVHSACWPPPPVLRQVPERAQYRI